MATPNYCSVDQLRDRLGLSDHTRDDALYEVCSAASRWVDRRTGRRFYTVNETRYYTASYSGWNGYGWAWIKDWNYERPSGGFWTAQYINIDDFVSVTAVATDEDGDGVYETAWTAGTDYWLAPRNAIAEGKPFRTIYRNVATGRFIFPSWPNAISVTGASGASTDTPDPIREIAIEVAMLMSRPLLDMVVPGVKSYKIGAELDVTFGDDEISRHARAILNEYSVPVSEV